MNYIPVTVDSSTTLYVLLGSPVEQSLSPLMQNRAFQELEINSIYLAIQVKEEDLGKALEGIKGLNIKGLNVTVPYKEKVIPFLDGISRGAQRIGAVNTIVNEQGKLIGHNTDGIGFTLSLETECSFSLADKRVVMVGAGGAARGVALQLLKEKVAMLTIVNRNEGRLKELVKTLRKGRSQNIHGISLKDVNWNEILPKTHLLIQTTSFGMYPHHQVKPLIPSTSLHKDLLVVDLIYNPLTTTLLREAKEKGCKTFGGWGMLLYQGALSFEIWTEKRAPIQVMKDVLLSKLKGQEKYLWGKG